MSDQRDPSTEPDPDLRALAGFRDPDDQGDPPGVDEIADLGEITDTRIYQGELEARPPDSDQPDEPIEQNLEMLVELELREGETDEPGEAAEEGLTWVPPIDPPIRPGDDSQPEVAAGFGTTARDEPFDLDHHADGLPAEDERTARVVEALRADASTSGLADQIEIETEGAVVIARGEVDDLADEENILAVISTVAGVEGIDNRLAVRGL